MKRLRAEALRKRRSLSASERASASQIICEKIVRSRQFRSASRIACFLPLADEVDTRAVIECAWRANKRIFVPVTRAGGEMFFREIRPDTSLRRTKLSIWEPEEGEFISPRALQLVITPTVAFDSQNNRIGMGGGYYDRCFSFLRCRKQWVQPKLLGVAFKCQQIEKISPNTWDVRLYRVLTEAR